MNRLAAITLAVTLATGCAGVPLRRVGERRPGDPTWLKAGNQQVRFVGALEVPANLDIEQSAFARFLAWLTGTEKSQALYRPFGVAVATDGRVAVTDPGVRAVRLYVPAENRAVELKEGLSSPLAAAFVSGLLVVADGASATLVGFDGLTGEPRPLRWQLPTFGRPTGLAVDLARERLFVADAGQHRVHVISLSGGRPTTLGERGEEPGAFNFPTHVTVDARGHLFVADSMNHRVQHFDDALAFAGAIGGLGDTPGDMPLAKGLAVDSRGTLWVVEGTSDVVQGFDAKGELVGVFGGSGVSDGRFWLPAGLAADGRGRLYVADTWNGRVQVFEVEPVALPAGAVATGGAR